MIDTIILHVYNLEKYDSICNLIAVNHRKEGVTKYSGVKKEAFEALRADNARRDIVNFKDSDNYLLRSDRSPVYIASSTYRPVAFVNSEGSPPRIEFNLSVPKFLYGTNLAQFIDNYEQGSLATFTKLMEFIEHFRLTSFTQIIDAEDICINRIDFCYNQFFSTAEKADEYFSALDPVFHRNSFKGGKISKYKDETLMRHTSQYSFKVYRKGPEFLRNDYKEVIKKKSFPLSPVKLKDIAHKVLRYESSFRAQYISDKWYWLYRDAPKEKRINKGIQNFVLSAKLDSGVSECRRMMVESKWDYWKEVKKYYYDHYEDYEQDIIQDITNRDWILQFKDNMLVTFNKDVFRTLYDAFWKDVKDHQISTISNIEDIKVRLHRMNLAAKGSGFVVQGRKVDKIHVATMLNWIMLSREGSIKRFVYAGSLSRSRYYEILEVLKMLGLKDYNPELSMAVPDLDYSEYKFQVGDYFHR